MKFKRALGEERFAITDKTKTGKKYNLYKGITYLVLDEKEPPDVHGIPPEMEAYGRGGFMADGSIFVDGGPSGSSTGHPSNPGFNNGFYWAVDQDAVWTGQDGEKRKGVIYIKGRVGTDYNLLKKNALNIMELLFKKIPRP